MKLLLGFFFCCVVDFVVDKNKYRIHRFFIFSQRHMTRRDDTPAVRVSILDAKMTKINILYRNM